MSCTKWRPFYHGLIHWGRVTHICVSKLTIIGSDNGLSAGRRQAIIGTKAGILFIGSLGTNFSELFIGIQKTSVKKMHLKMSFAKWRPFCLGLNVLDVLTSQSPCHRVPQAPIIIVNTLRPRQNGRHFADDIFKCILLNENAWIPNKISLKFVLKGLINNIPALVRIMAWRHPGDKPLPDPMMVSLLTHICVTRPQWVNLLDSLFQRIGCKRMPAVPQMVSCIRQIFHVSMYITIESWEILRYSQNRLPIAHYGVTIRCLKSTILQGNRLFFSLIHLKFWIIANHDYNFIIQLYAAPY